MTDGIKQRDVQKCACCQKGVMHDQSFSWYVVTIDRYIAKLDAISRQHHLEQMLKPMQYLACVLGPDEDLATRLGDTLKIWVCDECAMKHPLMAIAKTARSRQEDPVRVD